mgnify:CR=1 FL=1
METPVSDLQAQLNAWIGRSETVHDTVQATPVMALAATLYLVGALVWGLEDEEEAVPSTRFTMAVD